MPYTIKTKDNIVIQNIPDEISRDSDQLRQRVEQARMQRQQQQTTGIDSDLPTEQNLAADLQRAQQLRQSQPETSAADVAIGGLEVLGSLASGATGGALGATGGGIAGAAGELTGLLEEGEGEQLAADSAAALTFQPRTRFGQELLQDIGGALESLPAFIGGAPAASARIATTPTFKAIQAANKTNRLGSRVLQSASSTRKAMAEEIAAGNRNVGNIAKTLDADGTLIKNKNLKQAIRLMGDGDGAYSAAINFEKMSNIDKKIVNKMLDRIQENKESQDPSLIMTNRPADAIGSGLEAKILKLNEIKTNASKRIGQLVNGELGRKPVNVSSARNNFVNALREADVGVGENQNGRLVADASRSLTNLNEVVSDSKLNNILGRLQSGTLSAKEAHRLKRNLREMVSFDPLAPGSVRVSQEIETAFKRLSSELGESVNRVDNRYRVANQKVAESIDALKDADRLLGNQIMIGDDLAVSKLGALSKRIGTNLQSREQVIDLIDRLDDSLVKRGIRPKDDIKRQVAALADLEKIFKVEGEQSPFGFQSRITQGVADAVGGQASPTQQLIDATINKFRSMSELEFDDKMKALRKLSKVK